MITQAFRRGLRLLRQDAAFTVLAVCLLGVGQAASIAVLAAYDAVIVRPLPYPKPDQLVFIWSTRTSQNQSVGITLTAVPDFQAWQTRARTLSMGSFLYTDMNVAGSRLEPEITQGARVSADLFDVIGVPPALGRLFLPEEGRAGAPHTALVSYDYWQRRLDGAADAIGRTVLIDGEPHTIVGVLPDGLPFMDNVPMVHVFTPLALRPDDPQATRAVRPLMILGRVREGFTLDQAQAELNGIAQQIEREDIANAGIGARIKSSHQQNTEFNEGALTMLLGAVGLLLMTACLNAAGLLLTRTVARRAEFGLRASLGATRWHIVLQVLMEALPISLLSVLIAWPLAIALVHAMGSLLPWTLPRYNAIVVNARVVTIAAGVWLALTVGLALPPVLHAARIDLIDALGGGQSRTGGLRLPSLAMRKVLMVCQIALAVALLIGAGLLARTAAAMHRFALGFATERVITARIPFPVSKYALPTGTETPAALKAAEEMIAGIRTLPGVEHAGLGTLLPMGYGTWWTRRISPEASITRPVAQLPTGKVAFVGPDYFDALGATLRDGRLLSEQDVATSEPVAVVNETFVRALLKRPQAIGEHVVIVRPGDAGTGTNTNANADADVRTIVGVIANIRESHVELDPEPQIYLPFRQFKGEGWSNTLTLAIRTPAGSLDPMSVMASVRQKILAVDPAQPLSQIATTADLLDRRLVRPRFNVQMMTAVAILAIACVSLGIFAVFAYIAKLRSAEFAVRVALGASPTQVARLVLIEALRLSALGLAAGVIAAMVLVPVFRNELYGVANLDAGMIAAATLVVGVVTCLSLLVPARYASRVNATASLR